MNPPPVSIERLYELLADQATQGLSPQEVAELTRLLARWPHVDEDAMANAAAVLNLREADVEPLPAGLRARLEADATRFFAPTPAPRRAILSFGRPLAWSGWMAAAACLVILFWSWRPVGAQTPEQRLQNVLRATDVQQVAGEQLLPEFKARGKVVWSDSLQEGCVVLEDFPTNDPAVMQYQIWVVDSLPRNNMDLPVDGGVFDVSTTGRTVIIPFRPKLEVARPKLFAISREPPKGVVVSRKDFVLIAKIP
jgi:hypothetical protein